MLCNRLALWRRHSVVSHTSPPHLHGDWAHPAASAPGLGSPFATSAPGRGFSPPRLRWDWAHPRHICAGTRLGNRFWEGPKGFAEGLPTAPRCAPLARHWPVRSGLACGAAQSVGMTGLCRTDCSADTPWLRPHEARPAGCTRLHHVCAGTGLAAATSAPGLGPLLPTSAPGLDSPPPPLHRDWLTPVTSAPGLGLALATSAPGLGSPVPHLRRD
jgi:hypothetical protein